jgi:hypothetical protein
MGSSSIVEVRFYITEMRHTLVTVETFGKVCQWLRHPGDIIVTELSKAVSNICEAAKKGCCSVFTCRLHLGLKKSKL